MFAHQLAAPLAHDLLEYDPGFSARLSELASASPPQINSFGDLLQHPNPAIELLEKAKQFAKDHGHWLTMLVRA